MLNQTVNIGKVAINPALVLAPMSGITTSAFRRFIKRNNPDSVGLVVSELISVEGMVRKGGRTLEMMRFREIERPISLQIFGYEIESMRQGACMVEQAGADIVDINCGCPVPKVVKRGGGCELMRQPEHLARVIQAIRGAVSIPLTIKIRAGWNDGLKNAVDVARMAESEGVDALAVHGRTRAQLYRGECDWDLISEVAQAVKIPVFGSGDVSAPDIALKRLQSGVAGLYVGRATLANPLVFLDIQSGQSRDWKRNEQFLLGLVCEYLETLREDFPEKACVGKLKQLASRMCRGRGWGKELCLAMNIADQQAILERAVELAGSDLTGNNHAEDLQVVQDASR